MRGTWYWLANTGFLVPYNEDISKFLDFCLKNDKNEILLDIDTDYHVVIHEKRFFDEPVPSTKDIRQYRKFGGNRLGRRVIEGFIEGRGACFQPKDFLFKENREIFSISTFQSLARHQPNQPNQPNHPNHPNHPNLPNLPNLPSQHFNLLSNEANSNQQFDQKDEEKKEEGGVLEKSNFEVKEERKKEGEEKRCVICFESLEVLFLPCKHICTCMKCASLLTQGDRNCPMCRGRIESIMKVFIA